MFYADDVALMDLRYKKEMSPRSTPLLPPLIINGAPRKLQDLSFNELKESVQRMLNICCGNTLSSSGEFDFSRHPKPLWWPKDIAWKSNFSKNFNFKERGSQLQELLKRGYNFYQQERTLHLFEGSERNDVIICEEGDNYIAYSKSTGKELFKLPITNKLQLTSNGRKRSHTPTILSQPVVKLSPIPELDSLHKNGFLTIDTQGEPRRSLSIMGGLPKSPTSNSYDDILECPLSPPEPLHLTCEKCRGKFGSVPKLLEHSVQCLTGSKKEFPKRQHLLGIGLIPTAVASKVKNEINQALPMVPLHLPKKVLAKLPFSSEASRLLVDPAAKVSEEEAVKKVEQYNMRCWRTSWDVETDGIKRSLRAPVFPIVFPSDTDVPGIHWKLNRSDWRRAESQRKAYKKLITPCAVAVSRLSHEELILWSPDYRATFQKQHLKELKSFKPTPSKSPKKSPGRRLDHIPVQATPARVKELLKELESEPILPKNGAIRRKRKFPQRTICLSRCSAGSSSFVDNILCVSTRLICAICGEEEVLERDPWSRAEYHARRFHPELEISLKIRTETSGFDHINILEIDSDSRKEQVRAGSVPAQSSKGVVTRSRKA